MADLTRGQLLASQIKAHPEMTEQELATMIDQHIQAAVTHLRGWVIYHPELGAVLGLRATEQEVMAAVELYAREELALDGEHHLSEAATMVLVPEFDGDHLTINVYRQAERRWPYLVRHARKFDSSWPLQDFDSD